ncbi:MAG: hypothetical protein JWN25_2375 [Verrucomicrobiales bacterium]|nr:hypothetical protein [Verrucomicrobiales bacterium]
MHSNQTFAGMLFFIFLSGFSLHADSNLMKCEVRLIWGTNESDAPQKTFKAIDTSLTQKLSSTLAWRSYYEANKKDFQTRKGGNVQQIELSKSFSISLQYLNDGRLEARLFKLGKFTNRTVIHPKTGNRLVLAYDGDNNGAWFVVVKILDP